LGDRSAGATRSGATAAAVERLGAATVNTATYKDIAHGYAITIHKSLGAAHKRREQDIWIEQ
jgi:ATP-dependent exoDNAse (exonuclease V) alpha subunit